MTGCEARSANFDLQPNCQVNANGDHVHAKHQKGEEGSVHLGPNCANHFSENFGVLMDLHGIYDFGRILQIWILNSCGNVLQEHVQSECGTNCNHRQQKATLVASFEPNWEENGKKALKSDEKSEWESGKRAENGQRLEEETEAVGNVGVGEEGTEERHEKAELLEGGAGCVQGEQEVAVGVQGPAEGYGKGFQNR